MPPSCVVPGCDGPTERQKIGVSYHRFPLAMERRELCKQWLRAIRNPSYDENTDPALLKPLRVCSEHFTTDDFQRNYMAELMDQG